MNATVQDNNQHTLIHRAARKTKHPNFGSNFVKS